MHLSRKFVELVTIYYCEPLSFEDALLCKRVLPTDPIDEDMSRTDGDDHPRMVSAQWHRASETLTRRSPLHQHPLHKALNH
ncbi:hypothetical protein FB558_4737 [Pseudonocardia kunmingensis]|uniref:Uncharacterized protein n=1 Tax=Pseudonocardia kunmingensis TaxID=630975 RepID=A0A543DI24_9PSEU|nr:hypothetical protein FB558_4737 [Pseudonocardia kunmingensis]